MAIVVKRPKLSVAERLYLPAIATGLAITLKHLRKLVSGKTKTTMQYPEQRWDSHLPPWYRGAPALVKDEHGRERCVACQLCEFICPPRAITIIPEEIPTSDRWAKVEKRPQGIRDRHDPLHLLRHVRGGLPRAGHLPQKGLLYHRHTTARRWFTTRKSSTRWAAWSKGSSTSGTKRNSAVRGDAAKTLSRPFTLCSLLSSGFSPC